MFIRALEAVASMLIMMSVGFFFSHKSWLTEEGNRLLSSLVIRVAMPGMIIANILTSYTRDNLLSQLAMTLAPILMYIIGMPLSLLLARLVKVPENRRGVFTCLVSLSNSVFIGFPVTRAVLGEIAIPYATLYYLANTLAFWLIGALLIRRDADIRLNAGKSRVSFGASLKRMLSAPLVTLIVSFALVLLGVRLPDFVMSTASTLGNMVTPLSMIFIGSMLHGVSRGGIRWERSYGPLLAARFLLAPAVMLLSCVIMGTVGLARQTYFLQSGMSSMTQVAIIAHSYGADSEYTSLGVALTTLALLVLLPLYALFMGAAL